MALNVWIALGTALVLLACLALIIAKRRFEERLYRNNGPLLWRVNHQLHGRPRLRRVQ